MVLSGSLGDGGGGSTKLRGGTQPLGQCLSWVSECMGCQQLELMLFHFRSLLVCFGYITTLWEIRCNRGEMFLY